MRRLGIVALPAGLIAVVALDLLDRLAASPAWLAAAGLPAGLIILLVTTLVTSRRGLRFALRQLLATVASPFRSPPTAARALVVVAAATGEEMLFRLLGLWLLGTGPLGIGVTSAAFAVAHLPAARPERRAVTLLDAGLCGVLLAITFEATGGIAAAAVAHAVRNLALDSLRRAREDHERKDR